MNYGKKLTGREYDLQLTQLYSGGSTLNLDRKADLDRKAFDIKINYRLGPNFPKNKRDMLLSIQETHYKNIVLSMILHKLSNKLGDKLTSYFSSKFGSKLLTVLSQEECEAYLSDN